MVTEMAVKYSRQGIPPDHAYTVDDTLSVSIAVGRLYFAFSEPVDMQRFVTEISQGIESVIPDLNWKAREVVPLNGVDWASLELTFEAPDQAVYSWMLMTPADGTVYTFTCNATIRRLADFRALFDDVVGSVRLGP